MRTVLFVLFMMVANSLWAKTHYLVTDGKQSRSFTKKLLKRTNVDQFLTPVFINTDVLYTYIKSKKKCYLAELFNEDRVTLKRLACRKVDTDNVRLKNRPQFKRVSFDRLKNISQKFHKHKNNHSYSANRFNYTKNIFELNKKQFPDYDFSFHVFTMSAQSQVQFKITPDNIVLNSQARLSVDYDFWEPKQNVEKKSLIKVNAIDYYLFNYMDDYMIVKKPENFFLQEKHLAMTNNKSNVGEVPEKYFYKHKQNYYCFRNYYPRKGKQDCYELFYENIMSITFRKLRAIKFTINNNQFNLYTDNFEEVAL